MYRQGERGPHRVAPGAGGALRARDGPVAHWHRHGTAAAQPQHSHSTATAQPQHSRGEGLGCTRHGHVSTHDSADGTPTRLCSRTRIDHVMHTDQGSLLLLLLLLFIEIRLSRPPALWRSLSLPLPALRSPFSLLLLLLLSPLYIPPLPRRPLTWQAPMIWVADADDNHDPESRPSTVTTPAAWSERPYNG